MDSISSTDLIAFFVTYFISGPIFFIILRKYFSKPICRLADNLVRWKYRKS